MKTFDFNEMTEENQDRFLVEMQQLKVAGYVFLPKEPSEHGSPQYKHVESGKILPMWQALHQMEEAQRERVPVRGGAPVSDRDENGSLVE